MNSEPVRVVVPMEAMMELTQEFWYSSKHRKQQIKSLSRASTAGWPKKHVAYWRDSIELGWFDAVMDIYKSAFQQAGFMPFPNADTLRRGMSIRDPQVKSAGVVGSAVGGVLAVEYVQRGPAMPIHDSAWFVAACKRAIDDGRLVLRGGSTNRIHERLWEGAAAVIEQKAGLTLDLNGGRDLFSPV